MGYLTLALQEEVNEFWRSRIRLAEKQLQLHSSGKEIRDYLNNRESLCTPGFLIRRYLQENFTDLLEAVKNRSGCGYADLSKNKNVPWPETFNLDLAPELYRMAKENGIRLSSKTWRSYLEDAPLKMYGNTPFKIAFTLKMDFQTTAELLMASGQDSWCFRNPEHFIYYYCQNRPSAYSWTHAQTLIERYQNALDGKVFTALDATVGKTFALAENLNTLFSEPEEDTAADDALLAYMLENRNEFSGLSLTAREDFLRMSQYLAILYPSYSKIFRRKDPETGAYEEKTEDMPVTISTDGMPNLNELVRAMFNTGGWLTTAVEKTSSDNDTWKSRTASSLKRRESSSNIEYHRAATDVQADKPFLNSVQFFVDSYAHHLYAVERIYHHPEHTENVERRDVILFTYFFILQYRSLYTNEEQLDKTLATLTAMTHKGERMDSCMEQLLDHLAVFALSASEKKHGTATKIGIPAQHYPELFNEVLTHFDMRHIYLPDPFDRFIIMSLFAEDPDLFTEAVLWNTTSKEGSDNEAEMKEPVSMDSPSAKVSFKPVPVRTLSSKSPAFRPMLVLERTGEEIPITKNCFVLGRSTEKKQSGLPDHGIKTDSRTISRCHIAIISTDKNVYLADLSSRRETWLNGHHLASSNLHHLSDGSQSADNAYLLSDGDRIKIGDETLIFKKN